MRVAAIIQARTGSTRLPGKVLKPFGEKAVLEHVIRRVAADIYLTCIAIPETDTVLLDWLTNLDLGFKGMLSRGPEHDVLARYWKAAVYADADWVIRITADCPLVDAKHVLGTLARAIKTGTYARTPLFLARGLDVEAFPVTLLADAYLNARAPGDREHVTPWMQRETGWTDLAPARRQRWTLDTEEDYAWFCRLAQHVNTEPPHPTTEEVLDYIAKTGDVRYEPEA